MDQFDFDELQEKNAKKTVNKPIEKQSPLKNNKNNKIEDQFDFGIDEKPKAVLKKKNSFLNNDIEFNVDYVEKKELSKKSEIKTKQNQSILPKISLNTSPRNADLKIGRDKMDLALEELPDKKTFNEKQKKKTSKEAQQFDFAVYGTEDQGITKKAELKTNVFPLKQKVQEKKYVQTNSPVKNVLKHNQKQFVEAEKVQKVIAKNEDKKREQQIQDDYEQEYEQDILEVEQKPSQNKRLSQAINTPLKREKQMPKQTKQTDQKIPVKAQQKQNTLNNESKRQFKSSSKKEKTQSKPSTSGKKHLQPAEEKISRYKQMVDKSFPDDQTQQKVKKLKPDALNRLNDKMRQMIKGFSHQLTLLIDKNLLYLRKPQNQIKEEIEGEPIDPIQAQIRVLEQSKKNNQKNIEMCEKQLQNIMKTNEKMSTSVQSNIMMADEIQTCRNNIAVMSREISSLKSEVQKEGRKVTKLQDNTNGNAIMGEDFKDSKYKSVLEMQERLASFRIEFDKNKKKIQDLQQKIVGLQQNITHTQQKRNQLLEKAQNEGISFYSKEQKKKYDQLKKKRDQFQLFESRFNTSIKSKQAVIQHQITDVQFLIEDYQKRYQIMTQQTDSSKQRILAEINKAKKNPKINQNTREILTQLQQFMSEDNSTLAQEQISSLNYISQNIYKKKYQPRNQSKSLTEEKEKKKIAYKNYIQEVARMNEETKKSATTQKKVNQNNPFRKAVTPNESSQASHTLEKMARTKEPQAQLDKQKERVWKSSNTEVLLRNPLKKQIGKSRYGEQTSEQNPLDNKEIMKLIDKHKQKIVLKDEQKGKSQQATIVSKKPFTLRNSIKDKQQPVVTLKQVEKEEKQIEDRKKIMVKENNTVQETIGVKLRDQQLPKLQLTIQPKPTANTTPFRNLRLKKDKAKEEQSIPSQSAFKLPVDKRENISQKPQLQKQIVTQNKQPVEQANPLKPKRFTLRKKNESQDAGYMPSTRIIQANQEQSLNLQENRKDVSITLEDNKFKINQIQKSKIPDKSQQTFDPFKKFMANKDKQPQKTFITNSQNSMPLRLNQTKETQISSNKPKMNLFKKQPEEGQGSKKLMMLGDSKKQPVHQQQKFINPYAKDTIPKQQQAPKIQRQGRLKKNNPLANAKPINKNIFADVEDATLNSNIQSLNEPQPIKNKHQVYELKSINQDKELNVNDLLGIKKKTFEVDKDLLVDLPKDNKVGVKVRARGKVNDFFGDLEI